MGRSRCRSRSLCCPYPGSLSGASRKSLCRSRRPSRDSRQPIHRMLSGRAPACCQRASCTVYHSSGPSSGAVGTAQSWHGNSARAGRDDSPVPRRPSTVRIRRTSRRIDCRRGRITAAMAVPHAVARRCTLPFFRHEVHTFIRTGVPSCTARTDWMFGLNRRLVPFDIALLGAAPGARDAFAEAGFLAAHIAVGRHGLSFLERVRRRSDRRITRDSVGRDHGMREPTSGRPSPKIRTLTSAGTSWKPVLAPAGSCESHSIRCTMHEFRSSPGWWRSGWTRCGCGHRSCG